MAYYDDPNQDPNKQYAALTADAAPAPATTPAQRAQSTGSGQTFNFQRLLNANSGAGARAAQQLTGQASNAANAATQATNSAYAAANKAVDAATPNAQPVFNNTPAPAAVAPPTAFQRTPGARVLQSPTSSPNTPGTLPTVAGGHVASINAPGSQYDPQIKGLQGAIANSNYTGPTDASSYFGDAAAKTQAAQAQLAGLSTVGGRQAQLGGSLLDAILAGNQGGGALTRAAAQANGLGSNLVNKLTLANSAAAGGAQSAGVLQQSLADRLKQTTDAQSAAQNKAQADAQAKQQTADSVAAYNKAVQGSGMGPRLTYDQWSALTDAQKDAYARIMGGDHALNNYQQDRHILGWS